MEWKKIADKYYYEFGMNVNAICGDSIQQRNPYKSPADKNWEDYLDCQLPQDVYEKQKWEEATGLGMVLGYNDYRALIINNIDLKPVHDFGWHTYDPVIKEMLQVLGLPEDYEWVVYSGSGKGLHIIFKVESPEIDEDITFRTKSYSGKLGVFEFRWRDYLVLPPSYHVFEIDYKFYNLSYKEFPSEKPLYIPLDNVLNFLNKYCGYTNDRRLFYNIYNIDWLRNRPLDDEDWLRILPMRLIRTVRTFSGEWSGSTPPSSEREEFMLFRHCKSPEALNYIGVEYVIGRFVKKNLNTAQKLFLKSRTKKSHINLAILISRGLINGTKVEMWNHARIGVLSDNYRIFEYYYDHDVLGDKRYLFFDTETTGLPLDFNVSPYDFEKWPRLIQLCWVITDENGVILKKSNRIIRPDNFKIPDEISKMTGITQEYATLNGNSIISTLFDFLNSLASVDMIIGHNLNYDKKIIRAEGCRIFKSRIVDSYFNRKKEFCTMMNTVNICKIVSDNGQFKYPKLQELYYSLFHYNFLGEHNALNDTLATVKCFFELQKRGYVCQSSQNQSKYYNDGLPF